MKENNDASKINAIPYAVYISVIVFFVLLGVSMPLFFCICRRRTNARLRAAQDILNSQRRQQWLRGGMQSTSERGIQSARTAQAQGLPHPDQFSMHNVPV